MTDPRAELGRLLDALCKDDPKARETLTRGLLSEARRELDRLWASRPAAPRLRERFRERDADYQQLVGRIERISGTGLPVRIEGDAGSGKALAALTIHQTGARRAGPFLHVRGPDSPLDWLTPYASARQGTLLVTHVGALTRASQDGLLDQLTGADAGSPRLVVTAARDLERAVDAEAFSRPLEVRLRVLRLRLTPRAETPSDAKTPEPSLAEVESRIIAERLERLDWQQQRCAESLGIDRKTLYRKIRRYGLDRQ